MFSHFRKYFLLLLILFSFTLALAGPESIGSGSYIIKENLARLVDYFQLDDADRSKLDNAYTNTTASKLTNESYLYFDNGEFPNDPAFKHLYYLLNKWIRVNGGTNLHAIYPFVSTFANVKWKFTDSFKSEISEFYTPYYLPPMPVNIVAQFSSYHKMKSIIEISRPIWNIMPLQDQIGLLIHETFRNIQLGQKFNFDEDFLQKATTMMVICEPNATISKTILSYISNYNDIKADKSVKKSYDSLITHLFTKECQKDFKVPYHRDQDEFDRAITQILKDTIRDTVKK